MKKQFARQRTTAVSQDFILQTGGKCQIDGGYVGRPAD